ncbi:hypothetical protein ACCO45_008311 [Purpureocillium lilacinum]|uniref:Uncharacterized protein n=1 Tax=Purpureocillium lilacinum TaxID=33203 RepID=A0ACC4DNP2_PURLI
MATTPPGGTGEGDGLENSNITPEMETAALNLLNLQAHMSGEQPSSSDSGASNTQRATPAGDDGGEPHGASEAQRTQAFQWLRGGSDTSGESSAASNAGSGNDAADGTPNEEAAQPLPSEGAPEGDMDVPEDDGPNDGVPEDDDSEDGSSEGSISAGTLDFSSSPRIKQEQSPSPDILSEASSSSRSRKRRRDTSNESEDSEERKRAKKRDEKRDKKERKRQKKKEKREKRREKKRQKKRERATRRNILLGLQISTTSAQSGSSTSASAHPHEATAIVNGLPTPTTPSDPDWDAPSTDGRNLEISPSAAGGGGGGTRGRSATAARRRGRETGQRSGIQAQLDEAAPEIRLRIWRLLFVSAKPILVYRNWTMTYRRKPERRSNRITERGGGAGNGRTAPDQTSDLYGIAILRTCSALFVEGVAVLYGENTFCYRLRDSRPSSTTAGGAAAAAARGEEAHINVEKYYYFFRSLAIEAEPNRYSDSTMAAMAEAINVFAPRDGRPRPNINRLVLRVTPLREMPPDDDGDGNDDGNDADLDDDNGQGDEGSDNEDGSNDSDDSDADDGDNGGTSFDNERHYTFVSFFKPASPVMEAVHNLRCNVLRIDLMCPHRAAASAATAAHWVRAWQPGRSFTIDRSVEMILRGLREDPRRRDPWARDRCMLLTRRERTRHVWRMMDEVWLHVARFCRRHVRRTTAGGDWGFGEEWTELPEDVDATGF